MKVLKFGAVWCPGCLIMKPRFGEIEKEHPWLETEYFEYDDEKEMVEKFEITKKLPTFVFLDKEGNEFKRLSGEPEKDELIKIITENKNR